MELYTPVIALMALAFAAIVLAKLTAGNPAAASDGSPLPGVIAGAASPSAGTSGDPSATDPAASEPASGGVSPSADVSAPVATAASTRTYKVKAGDTLVGIAAKFDTTPKAVSKLNGISDPSSLKVGQVLKIP